jgi:HEPN domain-containing protein
MQPSDSPYPRDWLNIAERDLKRVRRAFRAHDPEQAGFYVQQAVEKFLKAFLLSRGWPLRRIHTLAVLLDDAITYEPSFEQYRLACQKITSFYMLDRYPTVGGATGTTEQTVRGVYRDIQGMIKAIRAALQPTQT